MLNDALHMLTTAMAPRTTATNPLKWQGVKNWKDDYANIEKLSAAEIAQKRADFDAAKTVLKKARV